MTLISRTGFYGLHRAVALNNQIRVLQGVAKVCTNIVKSFVPFNMWAPIITLTYTWTQGIRPTGHAPSLCIHGLADSSIFRV